ncbi:3,4-dihydroxy-2-butanone-4-phosphate synthase [Nocardia aobensis]|uniref:3,4-dihydroxy-2-butanone-4-phosphate synthase n=1 Tax=Nocardia aobensis TaxID=257277 RepID=A0ABW6PFJ1_9NOCA
MTTLLDERRITLVSRKDYLRSYAHAALVEGRGVVVVLDGTATLFYAASQSTTATTAFAIRHGSGLLRVALPFSRTEQLSIPYMEPSFSTTAERMCVSVDAAAGIATGISALDRSRTARILASEQSQVSDLIRPGHVMVVAVDDSSEPTTASGVALKAASISGLGAAAVATELVSVRYPTEMMDAEEAYQFAATHELAVLALSSS